MGCDGQQLIGLFERFSSSSKQKTLNGLRWIEIGWVFRRVFFKQRKRKEKLIGLRWIETNWVLQEYSSLTIKRRNDISIGIVWVFKRFPSCTKKNGYNDMDWVEYAVREFLVCNFSTRWRTHMGYIASNYEGFQVQGSSWGRTLVARSEKLQGSSLFQPQFQSSQLKRATVNWDNSR